ncbi:hypothetical protein HZS_4810 [Henneguya salminicola]|nr:hypothetical protein HZS_4810 [Henneguya salminicola]
MSRRNMNLKGSKKIGMRFDYLKRIELEKEMEAKTFELQMSYQTKFQELESSFKDIIGGKEVKMEECKKFLSIIPSSLNVEKYIGTPPPDADLSNGIKNYWLTVLQTFPRTSPMVNILDEPLLSHLTDVRVFHVSPENPSRDYPDIKNYGIVLELYFSENEYISNSKLYKCYHLGYSTDEKMLLDNSGLMPIHIDFKN